MCHSVAVAIIVAVVTSPIKLISMICPEISVFHADFSDFYHIFLVNTFYVSVFIFATEKKLRKYDFDDIEVSWNGWQFSRETIWVASGNVKKKTVLNHRKATYSLKSSLIYAKFPPIASDNILNLRLVFFKIKFIGFIWGTFCENPILTANEGVKAKTESFTRGIYKANQRGEPLKFIK